MAMVNQTYDYECNYPGCNKAYTKISSLQRHMKDCQGRIFDERIHYGGAFRKRPLKELYEDSPIDMIESIHHSRKRQKIEKVCEGISFLTEEYLNNTLKNISIPKLELGLAYTLDLSEEISIPFWDETFSGKINIYGAARLYQINSFFRELVLDLIKRGKVEDLNLYVFGYNWNEQLGIAGQAANLGVVGLNDNLDRNRSIRNDFFTEKGSIKQIVLGGFHSMILMDNGDLYVFGYNKFGQLGLNDNLNRNRPVQNNFFTEKGSIKQIVLGGLHSMVLMDNGDLYVFGNNRGGQLGIAGQAANLDAPDVVGVVGAAGLNDNLDRNRPIRNYFFTDKGPIKQIVLGGYHSMILMENDDLYVFGDNQFDQLGLATWVANLDVVGVVGVVGLNDNVNRNRPIRNDFFTDKGSIKHIILGEWHSMVLMNNGELYVFGYNGFGQLGLNDNLNRNRPIRNDFFIDKGPIKHIILAGFQSMVSMDNGDLYVFGYNGFGQLGLNDNVNRNRPIRNDFFTEKGSIKHIILGGSHSMILMDNDDLYVFGYNGEGQLGLNDNLDRNRPIRNDFFTDKGSIRQIVLGRSNSMVLTN